MNWYVKQVTHKKTSVQVTSNLIITEYSKREKQKYSFQSCDFDTWWALWDSIGRPLQSL